MNHGYKSQTLIKTLETFFNQSLLNDMIMCQQDINNKTNQFREACRRSNPCGQTSPNSHKFDSVGSNLKRGGDNDNKSQTTKSSRQIIEDKKQHILKNIATIINQPQYTEMISKIKVFEKHIDQLIDSINKLKTKSESQNDSNQLIDMRKQYDDFMQH